MERFDFILQYPGQPQQTVRATRTELQQLRPGYAVLAWVRVEDKR
jgi:hypothetical protein